MIVKQQHLAVRTQIVNIAGLFWSDIRRGPWCGIRKVDAPFAIGYEIVWRSKGSSSKLSRQRYDATVRGHTHNACSTLFFLRQGGGVTKCHTCVTRPFEKWRARQDSNLRPPA